MNTQRPELEIRRKILEQMRDELQAKAFQAEMNAEALSAQVPNDDLQAKESHEKAIADLVLQSANGYRGAEALSAQLAKLPKPKKAKP